MKKIIALSLVLLALPMVAFASLDTNLYYGVKNQSQVRELQEFLIDKGLLSSEATGNFYSLTLKAVKKYQEAQGLPQTGYVGTMTRGAINQELAALLVDTEAELAQEPVVEVAQPTQPVVPQSYGSPVVQPVVNSELSVSCSGVVDSLDNPNYQINFTSSVSGGDGNYQYYWSVANMNETGSCQRVYNENTLNKDCLFSGLNTFSTKSVSNPPTSINDLIKGSVYNWDVRSLDENWKNSYKNNMLGTLAKLWVKSDNKVLFVNCPIRTP
jgi:peptidoglycan hydrolase-like protein with peptidoglycan-binding domain